MTVIVRGGNEEKRENTVKKIQKIIAKEKETKAEAVAQRKKKEPSLVEPVEEPKQRERSASSGSAGSDNSSISCNDR